MLLKNGADKTAVDNRGRTPAQAARMRGKQEIYDLNTKISYHETAIFKLDAEIADKDKLIVFTISELDQLDYREARLLSYNSDLDGKIANEMDVLGTYNAQFEEVD